MRFVRVAMFLALFWPAAALAEILSLSVLDAQLIEDQRAPGATIEISFSASDREPLTRFTAAQAGRSVVFRVDGKTLLSTVVREQIVGGKMRVSGIDPETARLVVARLTGGVTVEMETKAD